VITKVVMNSGHWTAAAAAAAALF